MPPLHLLSLPLTRYLGSRSGIVGAPRFWFSAGKDAVRASGESTRRAPSAHSPSHINSHLIRSDTTPIPQWALLSALFIDLAVERWSACGSCIRQHASGCLKPLYSVYFWDEALWCLAALLKKKKSFAPWTVFLFRMSFRVIPSKAGRWGSERIGLYVRPKQWKTDAAVNQGDTEFRH